jgi:hypothetical protein
MTGTVTMTIEDYETLKLGAQASKIERTGLLKAAKELEVFLTFLITRENIDEHLDEFNSYSTTCKVRIVDGRAKIELLDNGKQIEEDEED